MSARVSMNDLRKMSPDALGKEIADAKTQAAKIRLGITLGKEKNHASLRGLRRAVARMETVRAEHNGGLKKGGSDATMGAPKKAAAKKKSTSTTRPKPSASSS